MPALGKNDSSLRNNQVHCTSPFNRKIITGFTALPVTVFRHCAEGPLLLARGPVKEEEAFYFNFLSLSVILSLATSSQRVFFLKINSFCMVWIFLFGKAEICVR